MFTDVMSAGAFRLRVLMTTHCAYDLTDGGVSERLMRSLMDEPVTLDELLRLGYLDRAVREERGVQIEGYHLSGFEDGQMSRDQRLAEREAARNRMRNVRASRKGSGVRANVRRTSSELIANVRDVVVVPVVVVVEETQWLRSPMTSRQMLHKGLRADETGATCLCQALSL
ncbi:hypothetical protein [Tessaracoccus flavus]|uniref:Uncharacterized protein n=1 Tax=Tessaracoccus flavus TaxID=1610493 RepID=A0A1Q2CFR2_9ACTN|nr:hypothetical protein [Tessaracoccus flavus]AQP44962.1 hypothetical protein RPIT_09330 [Tessaracoccus flavus]SDY60925.1 hypothetical protein SAMN05428934_102443 [Tessaracoccus flavus]